MKTTISIPGQPFVEAVQHGDRGVSERLNQVYDGGQHSKPDAGPMRIQATSIREDW